MRFAWLRKHSTNDSAPASFTNQLIFAAYNIIWWLPIILPVIKAIDYRTAFITFTAVTAIRLSANLYRNNVLTPEQAERFPFRAP